MSPLGHVVVVLHEPRDLVNIALVIRAMKNMGLSRLRLVRPAEFDPYRIEGIAHDTGDIVARTEVFDSLDAALADAGSVIGTTARRRACRHRWWGPEEGAGFILAHEANVALLFGREDRGLSNRELDRCQSLICIPTSSHTSMNLGHAAVLIFYELRRAAGAGQRDLSAKKRWRLPPASAGEMASLFQAWEEALHTLGFFRSVDPELKMRSFRTLFQRAELNRRELGLLRAVAYEVVRFGRRRRDRGSAPETTLPAADDPLAGPSTPDVRQETDREASPRPVGG